MPLINFYVRTAFNQFGLNPNATVNVAAKPQRARLRQLSAPNRSVSFPYGPQNVNNAQFGLDYVTVDRPGAKPYLKATTKRLRTVTFDAIVADDEGGLTPIQGTLDKLEQMASEDVDCQFTYGVTSIPYRVRISNFAYQSIRRDLDGNLTQASISLELKETLNVSQSVVALDAIQYPPDPKPSDPTKSSGTPKSSKDPAPDPSTPDPPRVPDVHDDRGTETPPRRQVPL